MLHAVERGIERAVFDLEAAVGGRLDPLRDPEAVLWTPRNRAEDQEFKGAGLEVKHRGWSSTLIRLG